MVQTVSGGEKEIDVGGDTGVKEQQRWGGAIPKEQMEIAEMQLSSNRGAVLYQLTLKCHSPATTKREGGISCKARQEQVYHVLSMVHKMMGTIDRIFDSYTLVCSYRS